MANSQHNPTYRSSASKVFWSHTEKEMMVSRAVDLQQERPDLAGLPLLREAMKSLPVDRRRKLIAVSQAPWFEEGMTREIKRRKAEVEANATTVPILREQVEQFTELAANHAQWRAEHSQKLDRLIELMTRAVSLLEAMNAQQARWPR